MRIQRIPVKTVRAAALGVALLLSPAGAGAAVTDFDDLALAPNANSLQASGRYQGQGVRIQTVDDTTDALSVGDDFFMGAIRDNFIVANRATSPSLPNLAFANEYPNGVSGGLVNGSREMLFTCGSPVTKVALNTDLTNEGAVGDVVRLLALQDLGGGMFRVVAVTSALDNVTTLADSRVKVAFAGGFTHAIFETTTEREGLDNLTYVPEPASMLLIGAGVVGLVSRRRTQRR